MLHELYLRSDLSHLPVHVLVIVRIRANPSPYSTTGQYINIYEDFSTVIYFSNEDTSVYNLNVRLVNWFPNPSVSTWCLFQPFSRCTTQ